MATDAEKRAAKAKKTRLANKKLSAKANEKHQRALNRATKAENKLKAFKEGFEYALDKLGGKL